MDTSIDTARRMAELVEVLRVRYGLQGLRLARLPFGQGAFSYRASSPAGACFVKCYLPGADLVAELAGIGLSEKARAAGIPAAAIVPNVDGQWLDRSSSTAVSVWSWVDGQVVTEHLSQAQYRSVGRTLGEIHRLFAGLPESRLPAPRSRAWREVSVGRLELATDEILEVVARRVAAGRADAFDARARVSLGARKAQLRHLPALMAALPELGSQVLHGDYTFVNLLFEGDAVKAVLDFSPPEPFLRAYDLGRIAFHPSTVARHEEWMQVARTLVAAYLVAHPEVPANDVVFCGRVALVQLLKSLYGVKEHYLQPGLIQEELDTFWNLRHTAVSLMLERLAELEEMLRSLASSR